ncbi:MAG TPA: amino acid racemase [Sphingomicrobium sp.]|nr:amino acid racemase [Sphingomicrobium sp.]
MIAHLGIVACSPPGAALCFEAACAFGARTPAAPPQISLHAHPFAEYMRFVDDAHWSGVADLMLRSAEGLQRVGAQLLVAPCNTIHAAFDLVTERSPLPWLHIAEPVAVAAAAAGYRRIGLLGTRATMEASFYPERLAGHGVDCIIPPPSRRTAIDAIIFDELVKGIASDRARSFFQEIIREFEEEGCEAVGLCCTELPLVISAEHATLPLLDSVELLAEAALERLSITTMSDVRAGLS